MASSQVIRTNSGPIEYTTVGDGYPVLVVHGAGGGYDQGLILAQFEGDDFRRIAISRFGYLRTPLPANASPAGKEWVSEFLQTMHPIKLQNGGHFLMGQHEKVRSEVEEFLKQNTRVDAEK